MTALGASSDVTDINSSFGVGGDLNVDPGESLRFTVENIYSSLEEGSIVFEGLTSIVLEETNEGNSHKYIIGQGMGLEAGLFSTPTTSYGISDADSNEFVVTGAGSNVANREWAISAITFMFRGPLTEWNPTDYSYYKIAHHMLDEYQWQRRRILRITQTFPGIPCRDG